MIPENISTVCPYLSQLDRCAVVVLVNGYYEASCSSWPEESFMDWCNITPQGLCIHLPKQYTCPFPLYVVHIHAPYERSRPPVLKLHHTVNLEEKSCLHLHEIYWAMSDKEQTESYERRVQTTFRLGQDARLYHTRVYDELPLIQQTSSTQVVLEKDSHFKQLHVDVGLGSLHQLTDCSYEHPGASGELMGLTLAKRKQSINHRVVLNHQAGQCVSQVMYRTAAFDRSDCCFEGDIRVAPKTEGTQAHLTHHNLLMSDQARIKSQPVLQIDTDELACTHGVTVGSVDEASCHYMQTRGIPRKQAVMMLVQAFFSYAIESFDNSHTSCTLKRIIDQALVVAMEEC